MSIKSKKIVCGFFLLFLYYTAFSAILPTQVVPNPVSFGQTFNLIINLKNQNSTPDFDSSSLRKDFQVIGISSNSAINIINNNVSRQNQIIITLMAHQIGKFVIPSLHIGPDQTKAMAIVISAPQISNFAGDQGVFLEAKLDNDSPYIQSEVLYTVKLYYNRPLTNASLTPPKVSNAILKQLGGDLTYQSEIHGKPYQVFQRTFAIFPQATGKQNISPPIFRAETNTNDDNNPIDDNFFNINTQPIAISAKNLSLDVKPKPTEIKDQLWLPAVKILMEQTWSQDLKQIHVGQPITRTITIKAIGLTSEQLPHLNLNTAGNVNSYPSQVKLIDAFLNRHLVGQRVEKIVYIPTAAGSLQLPEISLHWWDTKNNKLMLTNIPAQRLTILPANANQSATPLTQKASPLQNKQAKTNIIPTVSGLNKHLIIGMILLVILIIISLLFFFKKRRSIFNPEKFEITVKSPLYKLKINRQLKHACLQNDAIQAKDLLIKWANLKWSKKSMLTLGDFQLLQLPNTFAEAIKSLDKEIYSDKEIKWNGEEFWKIFKSTDFYEKIQPSKPTETLPSLYLNTSKEKDDDVRKD